MPAGKPVPSWVLRAGDVPVTSILFLKSQHWIVVGCQNGQINVWDIETRRQISVIQAHPGHPVLWTHETLSGGVVSQGRDGWLRWWSAPSQGADWVNIGSYEYGHQGFCACRFVACPPTGGAPPGSTSDARNAALLSVTSDAWLALPGDDSRVSLLDVRSMKVVKKFSPAANNNLYGMCLCMEVITKTENGNNSQTSANSDAKHRSQNTHRGGDIPGSFDSRKATSTSDAEHFPKDTRIVSDAPACGDISGSFGAIIQLLVGYENGSIAAWDVSSGSLLHVVNFHKEPVMCMAYDTNNRRIISGSTDEHLKVCGADDMSSQQQVVSLTSTGVTCLSWRTDGRIFVAGCGDGRAHLFSHKRRKLAVLECSRERVQTVTFSELGLLAVGSKCGTVTVWKLY